MKQHYVILSSGAYSDYSPIYFVGDKEITQEQLKNKSEEIGTQMWNEWIAIPTRRQKSYWNDTEIDKKYDPENPKRYISDSGPDEDEFMEEMKEWLKTEGFEELPLNIPEINVYYDVPGNPTE